MKKPPTMTCIDHSQPSAIGTVTMDADIRPLVFALQSIRTAIEERNASPKELVETHQFPAPIVNIGTPDWPSLPSDLKPTVHVHVQPAESNPMVTVNPPSVAVSVPVPPWVLAVIFVQSVAVFALLWWVLRSKL